MTKRLPLLTLLAAATSLHAQSLPDCRTPDLPIGAPCNFYGTTLAKQQNIGEITLPSSEHVRMTEPYQLHPLPPVVERAYSFSVGGLFTTQTETLGYKRFVSSGFKVFGTKQWSDWRGVDLRGTVVEFGLGDLGIAPGNNHTVAAAVGPRVQHSFGRVSPYGEILVGALHQYYYGMSESGVVGASVRLSNRFSLVPADVEYRYASLQSSTALRNPRRGRIELAAGLVYSFGR